MELIIMKPEQRELVDAYALEKFDKFKNDLRQEAHLDELTQADFNEYLSEEELKACIKSQATVGDWLRRCSQPEISIDTRYSTPYWALTDMINLARRVYWRKQAEQEKEEAERKEQERKKEEDERWHAAFQAVDPPIGDAKRYLDESEYSEFIKAIGKATGVYLEKGEQYLDDHRTFDYRWSLDLINNRKAEEERIINQRKAAERRKATAESQAQEYNKRLNSEVARLKQSLCHNEKDHSSYFRKQVNDPRYTGYSFNHILTDEDKQAFRKSILSTAASELNKLVTEDFRKFIDWKCWRTYILLPSADYSFEGVPCLDLVFDVFAVVETRVWLKPGQKSFGGYTFQFPWRREEGRSVLVQEPEFLGYHYQILTPSDLSGYVFWQTVPLVLLKGLLGGQIKPDGVTILAASDSIITYKIPKFKEDVAIPDSFASYLREIGGIDRMVSMGIITGKVAGIVKNELQPEQTSLEGKIERRDTKKARAFLLFNEGKRPGDPKVKSLGIKPETAYRYYQDWKKVQHSSQNAT